jgi:CubicO group peptidase (beta-lactamase class C family)
MARPAFLIMLMLLAAPGAVAQDLDPGPGLGLDLALDVALDREAIRRTLGELAQVELDHGTASVSVALVKDGEVVLTEAWGHANAWARTPATPETLYGTGSTLKAVTATAVLQLSEQGLLSLDDPANLHLGDQRLAGDPDDAVTIRHLLTHTSGLSDVAQLEELWGRALPRTLDEIPGQLERREEPGEVHRYNNSGYAVAGLIVERVSGLPYEQYLVQHVLQPLGVTTPAPIHPTPAMLERMALPYVQAFDERPHPEPFVQYDGYPAGDAYLTAEDMGRFLAAHLGGGVFDGTRLLSEASAAEAHRPGRGRYALGWYVIEQEGRTLLSHLGGVPGFDAFMQGDVDRGIGVIVLSNSGDLRELARAAMLLLAGEEYVPRFEPRTPVRLPVDLLAQYVGVYDLGGASLHLGLESGHLWARVADQRAVNVYAEGEDRLFYRLLDAQVTIRRDEQGEVTGLTLHQPGRELEADKTE